MENLIELLTGMAVSTAKMMKSALRLMPRPRLCLGRFSSWIQQPDLGPIREELNKFDGGSVDLELDEETGIAVMILNNPRRLNSLTGKMMVEMEACIDKLETWKTGKGVILMGADGNFCSGGDLTFVRKALHYGREMAAFQHQTLTRLLNLPLISCALVQGHTLGGGAELSTACDFRVMSSSASLGFVQIKMGLTTGWGATTRLVHLLGRHKALALLCSAKRFSAQEAWAEGLVDHVLPETPTASDEFSLCRSWLSSGVCKYDAELIKANKESIMYCDENRNTVDALANERDIFAKFWGGPIQKAALRSNVKHK